ncbi:MAG: ABC transporter permease subunit [Gaiellales bacterium]
MPGRRPRSGPRAAVARYAFRQERVRLGVFAAIAVLYTAANVVGYRDTYPTAAERERFAAAFGDNVALRLFYGLPHDLATVAGYVEFRVVGILSVILAAWAVFAAVRALRGEEDAGRFELVLAGPVRHAEATAAVLVTLGAECIVLWAATVIALLATGTAFGDISLGQSLLLGVAIVAPAALFAAVGALVCQVAATHRGAQALGGALVGLFLLLRIAADLVDGAGDLRWATPLGWAGEVRPVTGSRPAVLLLFIVVTTLAAWATLAMARRRDVGTGLLGGGHTPRSHGRLLGSPLQAAVRGEAPTLTTWVVGAGVFAALIGGFSKSIAEEARKANLHSTLGTDYTTPGGYLALTFVFFALVVALFAASHLNGIRDEEGSGRLETLLALSVGRTRWLAGRVAIAAVASVALAVLIGILAWAGAATQDAGIGFVSLVAAGANCIPAALLFLGLGTLLFAVAPRQSAGAAMALVGVAFLWELVGAVVGAPSWALALSPFHHVAAVPVARFDTTGAAIMLVVAGVAALGGLAVFARRDLQTS